MHDYTHQTWAYYDEIVNVMVDVTDTPLVDNHSNASAKGQHTIDEVGTRIPRDSGLLDEWEGNNRLT